MTVQLPLSLEDYWGIFGFELDSLLSYMFLKILLLMILRVKLNMFTFEWLSVLGRQMDVSF